MAGFGKRAGLVLLGMVVASSLSFALPVCVAGQSVASLGAVGCEIGSVSFTNFVLTPGPSIGGVSANATDANHITVSISYTSPDYIVVAANDTPAAWTLTAGQQFSFQLNYTVTGGGPYFNTFGVGANGTATGVGAGFSLSKSINGGGGTIANEISPTVGPIAMPGGPLTSFTVQDNIQVTAGNTGPVTLTSAVNTFQTPEPMSSMLLGSGLLAIGYLMRRKRS